MAVFPPSDDLRSLRRMLPTGERLTRLDKWHITLLFLGEVPDDRTAEIERILDDVVPPGPFRLRLDGGGQFGAAAWAGVHGDLARLTDLRGRMREALADGGFPIDLRTFTPHLTVSYHGTRAIHRVLAGYVGASWPVDEFALVRSVDGAYQQVRVWSTHRSGAES